MPLFRWRRPDIRSSEAVELRRGEVVLEGMRWYLISSEEGEAILEGDDIVKER